MYYLYRNTPGIFWQPAKVWPPHQTQCHALIHLLCSRNSCSCISHIQTGLLQMVYHPHSSITLNKSINLPTSSTTCTDRLPITHCIQFKTPFLTNRALNNQAPLLPHRPAPPAHPLPEEHILSPPRQTNQWTWGCQGRLHHWHIPLEFLNSSVQHMHTQTQIFLKEFQGREKRSSTAGIHCGTAALHSFLLPHLRTIDEQRWKTDLHHKTQRTDTCLVDSYLFYWTPQLFYFFLFAETPKSNWSGSVGSKRQSGAKRLHVINNQYLWLYINFTSKDIKRSSLDVFFPEWPFFPLSYTQIK